MRVELHPQNSIYKKALESKEFASYALLPLIEFEFAFHGAQKPVLTQSVSNIRQLEVLFEICKKHEWIASKKIMPLGKKNEYYFKLHNKGFKEIYELAGPMADEIKDKWARLLCERAEKTEKNRMIKGDLLKLLQDSQKEMSTLNICLETRRLPYTVTRHLRTLERMGLIKKTNDGWIFISASIPTNSPS